MINLYPEQLKDQLDKDFQLVYILIGNEHLLIKESQEFIRKKALNKGFKEYNFFYVDNSTDWQDIFSLFQSNNIFIRFQVIQILISENNNNTIINKQLTKLVSLLNNQSLLIISINKITNVQKNSFWFKNLSKNSVQVICQTPKQERLKYWIIDRAKKNNLQIEEDVYQLLCNCYEGNLLALSQLLESLTLLWPDNKINLIRIKQVINNISYFTPFQWIDSILESKVKRTLHILKQLRLEGREPVILLRILQRELILLINLKRLSKDTLLDNLFDKFHVWKNRRTLIITAVNRLNEDTLRQAIQLLTKIEVMLKKNHEYLVWDKLEILSLLLCNITLSKYFVND